MQVVLTALWRRTDEDMVLRKCSCKEECQVLTPRKDGKALGH